MRNGIREFQPRQPLDRQLGATTLNQILRELESLRITRVVNGTFRKLPGGTEITVAPQRGGGTPIPRQPWDLIARVDPAADPDAENPPYLVSVQPGTLNGFLPTNWNTEGGGKDVTCQSDGTLYYAKAIVATDGQAMTGVTIEIDENAPDPQEPQEFGIDSPIEIVFGLFAEGAVYRLIGAGNIAASPKLWLTTERQTPPAPGELPFSQYFFFR
jgi:hypothetical protein